MVLVAVSHNYSESDFYFRSCNPEMWSKLNKLNCYSAFIVEAVESKLQNPVCTIVTYQIFWFPFVWPSVQTLKYLTVIASSLSKSLISYFTRWYKSDVCTIAAYRFFDIRSCFSGLQPKTKKILHFPHYWTSGFHISENDTGLTSVRLLDIWFPDFWSCDKK